MDNMERGCLIPLGQSLVIGLVAGVVVFAFGQLMKWNAPGWLAVALGGATFLSFFIFSRNPRDDDDPIRYYPPPPPEPVQAVRVELTRPLDGGQQTQLIDLPADQERLQALAAGLLAGSTLSEAAWTGARGLFSRSEFCQLRDAMIRRGLAAWVSPHTPARGCQLTPAGRGVMRRFASESPAPLPRDPDHQQYAQ